MAGGGEGLSIGSKPKRGHSASKKKKRIGFKLDMTPLVDITFLLLTFFMFTTTMLKPQIMEMKIPPEWQQDVMVKASELFTIALTDSNKVFWYIGIPATDNQPEEIKIKDIRAKAIELNLKPMVKNKLITVLKIHENAKYEEMIRILDELNLAEIPITEEVSKDMQDGKPTDRKRKFTVAVLTQKDQEQIMEFKK